MEKQIKSTETFNNSYCYNYIIRAILYIFWQQGKMFTIEKKNFVPIDICVCWNNYFRGMKQIIFGCIINICHGS
jgi:hypothetical protein